MTTKDKGINPLTEEIGLFINPVDKSKANKEFKGKEFKVSTETYLKFEKKMSEIRKFSKSQYLASNAHFIYLLLYSINLF